MRASGGGAAAGCEELLPDQERVLGADHPDTLITRGNIASWTGQCGDPAEALRLYRTLLPDQERVLGPDHPNTLTTRNNIAAWTGECGDPAGALRLLRELLPDRERVLGRGPSRHPDAPATTSRPGPGSTGSGRGAAAVPGAAARPGAGPGPGPSRHPGHPRQHRVLDRECGNPAEALRLSRELLPDQERVLGPDHPQTLTTRRAIQQLKGPR